MSISQELRVWIPSNRTYKDGSPKAMDGLNEIISDNRAHRNKGARVERENVEWCSWYILQAMNQQLWRPMKTRDLACPVRIVVTFVEANNKRDVANIIGGGLKYLLDALSRPRGNKGGASAIYDDSPRWLQSVLPIITVNPCKPGIDLTVFRVEE